jgi:hypothetical protein
MAFDRKQFGMISASLFIRIADRAEFTIDFKVTRVSGPPLLFNQSAAGSLGKGATMKKAIPVCAMVLLVLSFASLMPAQGDPFLGTWKLNIKKSKFEPGPARKSEARMVVSSPKGMKVSVKRVNADGRTQEFEYTSNLDNKTYPIVGDGPEGADSIAANLTAPNTIQSTLKKGAKVIVTATLTVSPDGNTLTIA